MTQRSERSRRQLLGKGIDRLGQYGLPLAVGLAIGFWASDFGTPWLPHMLHSLTLLIMVSLGLILVGYRLRGKHVREAPEGARARRRIIALLVLCLLAAGAHLVVYWARQKVPLTSLDADTFSRRFEHHDRQADELYRQLDRMLLRLEAADLPNGDQRRPLTAEQEQLLRETWASSYDCAFALDQLRIFYEDWFRFDPSRASRGRMLRSYLLTFETELSLYEISLRWVQLVQRSQEVERFLNAPHPQVGLGADTFSVFRQELQGARDYARVVAGEAYLRGLESTLGPRGLEAPSSWVQLSQRIESRLRAIERVSPLKRASGSLAADSEILKRSVRRTWFPAQKGIANWMGGIRTRDRGPYLITPQLAEAMDPHLQPGDILLSRKNWHLSNVGLPGFWPHAILYLGDAEKLADYFDDPEVRSWAQEQGADDLPQLLRRQFPESWNRYVESRGHLGPSFVDAGQAEPVRLLEAVADGVVLTTMSQGFGDYLAALRPQLKKVAKARAIARAFSNVGKPYDYDFDFATDHALVCTEVVWRSYRSEDPELGLQMPVRTVAGRLTLPANDIARWVAESIAGDAPPPVDWVYFIDASESEGRAFVADRDAFLESHRRAKWDPLLE